MTDLSTSATLAQLPPPPELGWFGPELSLTPAGDLLATLIEPFDAGTRPADPAVPTGIAAFDDPGGGLAAGSLTILCTPPGGIHTRLLLTAGLHATGRDHVVAVYALGATTARLATLLAALASGIGVGRLRAGELTETEREALLHARGHLAALPLSVMVGQSVSIEDIRALSLSADDAPEMIIIDRIALLAHGGRAAELKHLAVDLDVAVLCSTTLPTGPDGRDVRGLDAELVGACDTIAWAAGGSPTILVSPPEDHEPTLADGAGSGAGAVSPES